ncbi:MAG: exonuclease V subunit gamma, partial [Chlamydiae bacterium]|nr:exonuclease V subunit gamma [Chlamydiota bacterium]
MGSSQLTEVEHVRGAILQLIHEKGFQFSDIAVLAPDIQSYASMIQFVFADLPFRIFDIDVGSKSFFFQGLKQLFSFNWNREDLISLFETPSFSRARNWDEKTLEWIRDEISFEE